MELSGDVAVIGAGLIGLGIAFELASRGATVRVFEREEPGRAASWAGAGMLAPYTEAMPDEAMLQFCLESLAMYPSYAARIAEATGVDVELHLDGIVNAAFTDEGVRQLHEHAGLLRERGVSCEVLDRAGALMAEPSLGRNVRAAIIVAGEGYVDNRRLGRALAAACERAGVVTLRDASEVAIETDARRVLGVRSRLGFASASNVIVAAGAWSGAIPGLPASCALPVYPVKGQMLALATPRGFVRRTTWVPGAYLVPRKDGRLLIGATVEDAEFDERVTAHGIRSLLDAVLEAAPALGAFTITESWAGLRPATPDARPILGPTEVDGLTIATGHYRNGILLTPATARLIANFVATGAATPLAPFSLARFGNEGAARKRISPA
ncbi:MAG: glycine oxidase ThiO [Candidatus Eremiobacteraeota bacterium]|nr:glycine oxidase ThiO [Candidatus Eremiobacteraeota bacterium]